MIALCMYTHVHTHVYIYIPFKFQVLCTPFPFCHTCPLSALFIEFYADR